MPSQTRVRRGFTRRFTGTAPSLLTGAVLLAAAVARAACADTNFVRRFASGGRHFYVVKDFALRDPADYETVTMPSACESPVESPGCRHYCSDAMVEPRLRIRMSVNYTLAVAVMYELLLNFTNMLLFNKILFIFFYVMIYR